MKYIKRIFENNMPKLTVRTLKYFDWYEISKLIEAKFGYDANSDYWKDFMTDNYDAGNPRRGGIGHMNLYYFGPRPKDCENDKEELERSETVFGWTNKDEQTKLFKNITHFIWDTVESEVEDIESCYFRF